MREIILLGLHPIFACGGGLAQLVDTRRGMF